MLTASSLWLPQATLLLRVMMSRGAGRRTLSQHRALRTSGPRESVLTRKSPAPNSAGDWLAMAHLAACWPWRTLQIHRKS